MKRNYLTLIFIAGLFSCFMGVPGIAQPTPPEGTEWEVVESLTDEFDIWDSTKWWKPLWNYGEPVQMRAENSGVAEGNLWIKATLDEGATRWFETSRVMSYSTICYPMYTECRMRTAHISAYNTYWLNNGDINNRDEFDICENNSKPSITSQTERPYTMYSQYFIVVNGNTERHHGNFDNRNLSDTNQLKGVIWNEEYHTLGAWWIDEHNIQFYLDGEKAGKVTSSRNFTKDLNIIWDLWTIDADWSGGIANKDDLLDDEINTMYVDWIRTYQLTGGIVPITGIIINPTTAILEIGETRDLTVTITPSTATNKAFLWASDDTLIATVKDGVVTGRGDGKTFINAETEDGAFIAKCEVSVGDVNTSVHEETPSLSVLLYPNPVVDVLHINTANFNGNDIFVAVYNTQGQLVKNVTISKIDGSISLENLPSGIYIVKVQSGNQSVSKLIHK